MVDELPPLSEGDKSGHALVRLAHYHTYVFAPRTLTSTPTRAPTPFRTPFRTFAPALRSPHSYS